MPARVVEFRAVSSIDPKDSVSVDFDLFVDPDAESKIYKVPLRLQYSDLLRKNYSKTLTVALVVGDEPDLSIYVDSSTIYTAGNTGEITVKIVNKGLTNIKFLNVNLDKASGYRLLSADNVYIGNIDSDDYETVDFKLSVEDTASKSLVLPLSIEYKDANNKNYKSKVNLELPLYTSSEARKLGLVQSSNSSIFIIVIIVAIVGFFGYRIWRKRKK